MASFPRSSLPPKPSAKTPKRTPGSKLISSTFMITVNPNQDYRKLNWAAFEDAMQTAGEELSLPENALGLFKRGRKQGSRSGDLTAAERNTIEIVQSSGRLEVGGTYMRAHSHILLTVTHRIQDGGLHLDRNFLLDHFGKALATHDPSVSNDPSYDPNTPIPHLNITGRATRGEHDLFEYINKNHTSRHIEETFEELRDANDFPKGQPIPQPYDDDETPNASDDDEYP